MERARRLGATRIVVAPYFLFPGVLPDRSWRRHAGMPRRSIPASTSAVAGLLGDCDELADVVTERYRETITGDIRMNCDTCLYRVAMPGHDTASARRRRPHHHP